MLCNQDDQNNGWERPWNVGADQLNIAAVWQNDVQLQVLLFETCWHKWIVRDIYETGNPADESRVPSNVIFPRLCQYPAIWPE